LRNNLKVKKRNKKISKWRALIKNQNENGLNSKIPIATVPELPTVSKPKMEPMVPCDQNQHIIYRWKEHREENTIR
jgi:hypothetical protein